MVAWSRMTMYEEDVDSERMHLDEGRVYELNIVFDEMLNEAVRENMQKQNAEAKCRSEMQKQTPMNEASTSNHAGFHG